jgi:hypothetical protein
MKKKTLLEKAGMTKFSLASATNPEIKNRINKINRILEKNKVRPDLRKKLTDHRWACEQKLNRKVVNRKNKKSKVDINQMALPGFLRQMDVVKFEELIANKIREEIAILIQPARKTSKKGA